MWWIIGISVVYSIIGVLIFIANMSIGPVTPGLCALRGALWPLWLAGGLRGRPEPMD